MQLQAWCALCAEYCILLFVCRGRNLNWSNLLTFALQHIRERWPHYNHSSGGSNHIVLTNSDWGNCEMGGPGLQWSMSPVLDGVMTLTLWGMTKNMVGGLERPCFRPGRDIVLPPIMSPGVYK